MLVGHFAVAFVGKRIEPKISLGTFVLASMLPDVLWTIFSFGGIEYVPGKTGIKEFNPLDVALSHSLLMVAIWGGFFAGGYFCWRRFKYHDHSPKTFWILFWAVLSHWLLDSISHEHAFAPGVQSSFGLRLWNSMPATILAEGGFWLFALIVYVRGTSPMNRAGVYAFWPVVSFLTFVWITNIHTGPPPPETLLGSFIFFSILVAWGYWMNTARRPLLGKAHFSN